MKIQLAAAWLCCAIALHAQSVVRFSGSTTLRGALEPKQAALEAAAGRKIEFGGTSTANGLMALASGGADVAMLSAPLEDVARGINQKTPGRVDPSAFRSFQVGEGRTVFIVNPRNPVRTLSATQLSAILTGQIENWKDVGGPNAAISVVSLNTGGSLLDPLLHGGAITTKARQVASASQIPAVVAQDANAIGIISAAHARGRTSLIQTDAKLAAPLFLVTKGEPGQDIRTLIDAAKKVLSEAP